MSAAILTDKSQRWRPNSFVQDVWGCKLNLVFPIIKLIDYKFEFLDKSSNPIAKVVQAHLTALKTQGNSKLRLDNKLFLVKKLYPLGFNGDQVRLLYLAIDYMLSLPAKLDREFIQNMKHFEQEIKKPYISFAERYGKEQGIEQGIEQGVEQGVVIGRQQILKLIIEAKFGKLNPFCLEQLEKATSEELEQIAIQFMSATTVEDLFGKSEISPFISLI
jgi:hypothetical protein